LPRHLYPSPVIPERPSTSDNDPIESRTPVIPAVDWPVSDVPDSRTEIFPDSDLLGPEVWDPDLDGSPGDHGD
jgi:hypothetical protein